MPRNIGVKVADEELKSDIILFLDSDDLAHPMRVEKTKEIFRSTNADLVYSPFHVVDEHGNDVKDEKLPNIIKLIKTYLKDPPVGKDVWKIILSEKLYINLTTVTSTRIELAKEVPFPEYRNSEDTYANIMYSAHGAIFHCAEEIPGRYRIPQTRKGISSMNNLGKERFFRESMDAFLFAFYDCTQYALKKGTTNLEEVEEILAKFYKLLIIILKEDEMHQLVDKFQELAGKNYQYLCTSIENSKRGKL